MLSSGPFPTTLPSTEVAKMKGENGSCKGRNKRWAIEKAQRTAKKVFAHNVVRTRNRRREHRERPDMALRQAKA